jgi:DNA (cytosine-5)-methyltransferase 1
MPKKKSYITVTDQFCGAGGSSQGVRRFAQRSGGGIEVKLAMNHWKLAIETHNTNFPETLHDCTDVSACDPRRYPSTDILITSPECTKHSLAQGVKIVKKQLELYNAGKIDPSAERSRATMWDVPRFAEYHNYNAIIVENVVDARKWVLFDSWLHAMHTLGYNHRCSYLNSMHFHPTPQSRDRMYVVFWKKGNKAPMLDYMPTAHCPKCGKDIQAIQTWKDSRKKAGKYKQQYVYCCPVDGTVVEPYYYASFNCIDWTDLGQRIGDRSSGLAGNTLARIKYGIEKYGDRAFKIDDNNATVLPFIIKLEHSQRDNNVKSIDDSMATQTTRQSSMLIRHASYSRSISEALQTQTTCQSMGLVTTRSWNSFIASYYNGSNCTKHITEEFGTFTTVDRMSLVSYEKPSVEDCYYRILKALEVKLGMAFDKDYVVLGTNREQVKQCGNAVTPPAMEWLTQQVIESLK